MSLSEAQLLQDLQRRVEQLEEIQRHYRSGLFHYNAERTAAAKKLRRVIEAAMAAASPQRRRLTSKHVWLALDRCGLGRPDLSYRTVRYHMMAIRVGKT